MNNTIETEIRYLNGDDIEKLEKYLHEVCKIECNVDYFFKFNEDRSEVSIKDKRGYYSVNMPLSSFVTKTITKLRIFLKFKDRKEDSIF